MSARARAIPVVAETLGKCYREGFLMRRRPALVDVGFTVGPAAVYGLLGPNGAGKSTTLRLLMGFVRPSGGRVTIFGRSPVDARSRLRVGFLGEAFAADGFTTGRRLLARFDALAGRSPAGRDERVATALEAVDLVDAAGRRVGDYSRGMIQRLGFAQAILGDPDLLVLDEPMSGMDPAARARAREILVERRERGKATLLSSHVLSDVEHVADRVLVLRDGRTVAEGPLDELRDRGEASTVVFRARRAEGLERLLAGLGLVREPAGMDACRVAVRDERAKQRLLAALAREGAQVISVTPRGASLESVFLELTGRGTRPPTGCSR